MPIKFVGHSLIYSRVRGEAAKLAHLFESASLKKKYMTKNYGKIFIE